MDQAELIDNHISPPETIDIATTIATFAQGIKHSFQGKTLVQIYSAEPTIPLRFIINSPQIHYPKNQTIPKERLKTLPMECNSDDFFDVYLGKQNYLVICSGENCDMTYDPEFKVEGKQRLMYFPVFGSDNFKDECPKFFCSDKCWFRCFDNWIASWVSPFLSTLKGFRSCTPNPYVDTATGKKIYNIAEFKIPVDTWFFLLRRISAYYFNDQFYLEKNSEIVDILNMYEVYKFIGI